MYRTTDGGATWSEFVIPRDTSVFQTPAPAGISQLLYDEEQILFRFSLSDNDWILRSFDDGKTWEGIDNQVTPNRLFTVSPVGSDTLYANTLVRKSQTDPRVYNQLVVSYDGGQNWEFLIDTFVEETGGGGITDFHLFHSDETRLFRFIIRVDCYQKSQCLHEKYRNEYSYLCSK